MGFDVSKTKEYYCSCGCGSFVTRTMIRMLPALLNPETPHNAYLQMEVTVCEDCHKPVYELLPNAMVIEQAKKVFEDSKSRKN